MGFFSELREDLSQAVNELMPDDTMIQRGTASRPTPRFTGQPDPAAQQPAPAAEAEAVQPAPSSAEPEAEAVQPAPAVAEPEAEAVQPAPVAEPEAEAVQPAPVAEPEVEAVQPAPWAAEPEAEAVQPAPAAGPEPEAVQPAPAVAEPKHVMTENKATQTTGEKDTLEMDDCAFISKEMFISGDVEVDGGLRVAGHVLGTIETSGALFVTGRVEGDIRTGFLHAEGAKINGNLEVEGEALVGADSVIKGNLVAESAVISGAIKGDIDVSGKVVLDSSAVVVGNIRSKSVQINSGAVIEGLCSQCYADVSPTSIFDEE